MPLDPFTPTPPPLDQREGVIVSSAKPHSRWLVFVASGLVAIALLAGGLYLFRERLFGPARPQTVALTYWGSGIEASVMQPLIDAYHHDHPNVTIAYEDRPLDTHYATVKSRLALTGEDVPDLVRVHASWMPVLASELAPLPSSVMSTATYEQTFYPVTKQTLLYGGNYYGIPLEVDGLALVVNQDLFAKAGITTAPKTWDEVRQDAAKITVRDKDGAVQVGGIALGTAHNVDNLADIIGLLMAQNHVTFFDPKYQPLFQKSLSEDGRNLGAEALQFYTLFANQEHYWDDQMENSTVAFSKGKVGMILAPSSQIRAVLSQNPQLHYGVVSVPQLTSDQHVGYGSYWVEAVAKNTTHQAEAWDFLRYLSAREQQLTLAQNEQQVRPFAEPSSRVDLASTLAGDLTLGPYVQQAPYYQTSLFTDEGRAADFTDRLRSGLTTAVQQTVAGGATDAVATAALETLATTVTQVLNDQ